MPVGRKHHRERGERGHLELLKWARDATARGPRGRARARRRAAPRDAEVGHRARMPVRRRDVSARGAGRPPRDVKVAARNGCPWDGRTCAYAALRGYRRVVEWSRANGCPWSGHVSAQRRVPRSVRRQRRLFSFSAAASRFGSGVGKNSTNRDIDASTRGARASDVERALRGRFSVAQVRDALTTLEVENYVRSNVKEYYVPIECKGRTNDEVAGEAA